MKSSFLIFLSVLMTHLTKPMQLQTHSQILFLGWLIMRLDNRIWYIFVIACFAVIYPYYLLSIWRSKKMKKPTKIVYSLLPPVLICLVYAAIVIILRS